MSVRSFAIAMEKDVEEFKAEADVPLVAVTAEKFGELEIKPREFLLNPCITAQSLGMIHAPRGCGKTSVTLGLVVAMASGTEWLKWDAPKPVGVLYVDGELPAIVLRDKLKMMVRGMNGQLLSGALKIITPDLQNRPMPDLSLPSGQALIEQHLDGVSVLILDNLSCLVQAAENEDQDWAPVQQWLLALRRRGIAVLFIHHSGKSGKQRGISKREDLLDYVIALRQPSDYSPDQGLRCEVHFEKSRSITGDSLKPFEVRMETGPDGDAIWTRSEIDDSRMRRAAALFADGMSVRDVAEELQVGKSTAHRLKKRWESEKFAELAEGERYPTRKEEV